MSIRWSLPRIISLASWERVLLPCLPQRFSASGIGRAQPIWTSKRSTCRRVIDTLDRLRDRLDPGMGGICRPSTRFSPTAPLMNCEGAWDRSRCGGSGSTTRDRRSGDYLSPTLGKMEEDVKTPPQSERSAALAIVVSMDEIRSQIDRMVDYQRFLLGSRASIRRNKADLASPLMTMSPLMGTGLLAAETPYYQWAGNGSRVLNLGAGKGLFLVPRGKGASLLLEMDFGYMDWTRARIPLPVNISASESSRGRYRVTEQLDTTSSHPLGSFAD